MYARRIGCVIIHRVHDFSFGVFGRVMGLLEDASLCCNNSSAPRVFLMLQDRRGRSKHSKDWGSRAKA